MTDTGNIIETNYFALVRQRKNRNEGGRIGVSLSTTMLTRVNAKERAFNSSPALFWNVLEGL